MPFLYRLRSRRAATSAAALLAAATLASSALSARASARIEADLQENWRGAYDLLVTAGGALDDQTAVTGGLIEQNFSAFTGAGALSPADLSAIRGVADVQVAAPLAFIGQLTSPAYGVLVGASGDEESALFSGASAVDIAVDVVASDGVQPIALSHSSTTLVTSSTGSGPVAASSESQYAVNAFTSGDGTWGADVTLPGVPELTSGVVAVDPAAEQQLLGGAVFLDPLARADELIATGSEPSALSGLVDADEHAYEHFALANGEIQQPPLPVVVSDSAYAEVTATITTTPVDLIGVTLPAAAPPQPWSLEATAIADLAAAQRGAATLETVDLTSLLAPFSLPYLSVSLPGADSGPGGTAIESSPSFTPRLTTRSDYVAPDSSIEATAPISTTTDLVATPQGRVKVGASQEQTYRRDGSASTAVPSGVFFAPIGQYTPGDVTGTAADASYVPLGTYASGAATVVSGQYENATLLPAFSGRGSLASAPGAITSLSAVRAAGGEGSADVVRVRVADVDNYSPTSLARIEQVAADITDLGLDVRVVAGASLAPAGVYLPEYFADGTDLGWTVQEWTSLGAAVAVERANATATVALLVIALSAVALLVGVALFGAVPSRRREAALLAAIGWTRARVMRWNLAESTPGLAVVAAAALTATVVNRSQPFTRFVVPAVVVLYVLSVALSAGATVRSHQPRARRGRRAHSAQTPLALGLNLAASHPAQSALIATALAILGGSSAGFVRVLQETSDSAGNTRLADLVTADALLPRAALVACALLAGLLLLAGALRELKSVSAPSDELLAVSGWARTEISTTARARVAPALVLGVLLSAAVATGLSVGRDADFAPLALALAVTFFAASAALILATRRAPSTTNRSRPR